MNSVSSEENVSPEEHEMKGPSPMRNLKVDNIPKHWSTAHFRAVFDLFGPTRSVQLMRESKTGLSKGFGFVFYHDTGAAQQALQQLPHIETRRLEPPLQRSSLSVWRNAALGSQGEKAESNNDDDAEEKRDQCLTTADEGDGSSTLLVMTSDHQDLYRSPNVDVRNIPITVTVTQARDWFIQLFDLPRDIQHKCRETKGSNKKNAAEGNDQYWNWSVTVDVDAADRIVRFFEEGDQRHPSSADNVRPILVKHESKNHAETRRTEAEKRALSDAKDRERAEKAAAASAEGDETASATHLLSSRRSQRQQSHQHPPGPGHPTVVLVPHGYPQQIYSAPSSSVSTPLLPTYHARSDGGVPLAPSPSQLTHPTFHFAPQLLPSPLPPPHQQAMAQMHYTQPSQLQPHYWAHAHHHQHHHPFCHHQPALPQQQEQPPPLHLSVHHGLQPQLHHHDHHFHHFHHYHHHHHHHHHHQVPLPQQQPAPQEQQHRQPNAPDHPWTSLLFGSQPSLPE